MLCDVTVVIFCFSTSEVIRHAGKFLELHYKIQPVSDHVAKFHGDRPRDLGERVTKEKNITGKIEDVPHYRTGGLKR